ncbi:MAG: GH116 family glycosyl-hydrolase [Bacteroidetes bacterium]|nr:GH116 family glycosyl-hydrolase [Bacteroidota bacterium]MDA1120338.1 GH116 family glycosyl-hydrolase [Bacteroidota bacterium]
MKAKSTLLSLWFVFQIMGMAVYAQQNSWPVLKNYDQDHVQRIAMPIGGIGTGTISLTGRGGLRDWEVMNRPAKGFNPWLVPESRTQRTPFFAIYIDDGNVKTARLLEGPLSDADYEGSQGSVLSNHGLPRFNSVTFRTAYPFGEALLRDSSLPVDVRVGAFNPLIPGNVDDSSIPIAVITYTVTNTSDKPLTVSIGGVIQNFIGFDGLKGKADKNVNTYREEAGMRGIHYTSNGVSKSNEQWGTLSLVTTSNKEISYRTNWNPIQWGSSSLDYWDDFTDDGVLENRPANDEDAPVGSLAVKSALSPGQTENFEFLISWHFPNRPAWSGGWTEEVGATVGNYYTTQYKDSWDVLTKTQPRLKQLETATKKFVKAFIESDIPGVVKEAALFNLAHLRTQLAFRIKDGQLLGWEGSFANEGACFGSCTHVWNYEQTTAFLFGDLAKTMRDVEFGYATDDEGLMSFRVYLPLQEHAQKWGLPAADGQMGSIMQFYREWQLSGDDEFLKKYWPKVKKSLEFSWISGGWDADKDGVMEGSQHNTMDVEYFGPNPQMGFWYLGALRAAEEMAIYLDDKTFAKTCRTLYENGSNWLDENLFNGEYYEQDIRPPMMQSNVAPSLMVGMGSKDLTKPDYQLGKGVLVDQLIGQVMSHIVGLGYLANEDNIKKTHNAIMKYNYRESLEGHTNFMRSYALGDEAALLMAGYPGARPTTPFPYFTEVMTGFEYTAAIGMLYEKQLENGLKSITNIRARYDGKKRSPFNEAEYGNHYARSMIAWAGVLAMTEFNYSAVNQSMSFTNKNGTYFWSNGYQYGTVTITDDNGKKVARLNVFNSDVTLKSFELKGYGMTGFKKGKAFKAGEDVEITVLPK